MADHVLTIREPPAAATDDAGVPGMRSDWEIGAAE